MMKIFQVNLKDIEILLDEETDEFKQFTKNEKKYPCFITNYSLKLGSDLGITKGSLVADILKFKGLKSDNEEEQEKALQNFDQVEMQKVIYLGFLGANKNTEMNFDSFLEKFHYSFEETVDLYVDLITNLMSQDANKFAKGLKGSTKKGKK